MGNRQMQVDLHHVADVRDHRQAMGVSQIGGLPPGRDAADPRRVGLYIVDRPGGNELPKSIQRVLLFAERDGRGNGAGQRRMARHVVEPHRLFEPMNVIVGKMPADVDRGGQIPASVRIDHELHSRANRLRARLRSAPNHRWGRDCRS